MHGQNILTEIYEYSETPKCALDLKQYLEFLTDKHIGIDSFVAVMGKHFTMWFIDSQTEEIRFYCKPTAYTLQRFLYAERIKQARIQL